MDGCGGESGGGGEDGSDIGDGCATVIPRHELVNVQAVVQLEKDTILVCYDSKWISNLGKVSAQAVVIVGCKLLPSLHEKLAF